MDLKKHYLDKIKEYEKMIDDQWNSIHRDERERKEHEISVQNLTSTIKYAYDYKAKLEHELLACVETLKLLK